MCCCVLLCGAVCCAVLCVAVCCCVRRRAAEHTSKQRIPRIGGGSWPLDARRPWLLRRQEIAQAIGVTELMCKRRWLKLHPDEKQKSPRRRNEAAAPEKPPAKQEEAEQEEAEQRRIAREKEAEERRIAKAAHRAGSPLKETAVSPTNKRAGSPKNVIGRPYGAKNREWSTEEDKQLKELRARGDAFTVSVLLLCCCCTGGWHTAQAASRSGCRGLVVRAFP